MSEYRIDKNNVLLNPMLFDSKSNAAMAATAFDTMMRLAGYNTDVCMECKPMLGIVESFVSNAFHSVEYWVGEEKGFYRAVFAYKNRE